jgi:DNA-directed RNA polymerase subunit beta
MLACKAYPENKNNLLKLFCDPLQGNRSFLFFSRNGHIVCCKKRKGSGSILNLKYKKTGFLSFLENFKNNRNRCCRKINIEAAQTLERVTDTSPKILNNLNKLISLEYSLDNFHRSNQDTCLVHKPSVFEGQWVQSGDLLADCSASVGGELALGQNILIAYMPWEGYNFEDAILVSERLVYDDLYTSVHIERYEVELRETKLGFEEITREIPDVDQASLKNLNVSGIAKLGSWVEEGDILVGKVTPINKKSQSNYQKLLYTILDKAVLPIRDSSLRAPKGIKAKVIGIQIFKTSGSKGAPPPSGGGGFAADHRAGGFSFLAPPRRGKALRGAASDKMSLDGRGLFFSLGGPPPPQGGRGAGKEKSSDSLPIPYHPIKRPLGSGGPLLKGAASDKMPIPPEGVFIRMSVQGGRLQGVGMQGLGDGEREDAGGRQFDTEEALKNESLPPPKEGLRSPIKKFPKKIYQQQAEVYNQNNILIDHNRFKIFSYFLSTRISQNFLTFYPYGQPLRKFSLAACEKGFTKFRLSHRLPHEAPASSHLRRGEQRITIMQNLPTPASLFFSAPPRRGQALWKDLGARKEKPIPRRGGGCILAHTLPPNKKTPPQGGWVGGPPFKRGADAGGARMQGDSWMQAVSDKKTSNLIENLNFLKNFFTNYKNRSSFLKKRQLRESRFDGSRLRDFTNSYDKNNGPRWSDFAPTIEGPAFSGRSTLFPIPLPLPTPTCILAPPASDPLFLPNKKTLKVGGGRVWSRMQGGARKEKAAHTFDPLRGVWARMQPASWMQGGGGSARMQGLEPLKGVSSVQIYLAEKRRIQVGDKMAGRHGNKGIISQILPIEDMPFLPDGKSLDMVLNPLGVPSRMNVGQIYECLLGLAGKHLGENFKVFPFDEIYGAEASRSFVYSKLYSARTKTGKQWLFNQNSPGKIRLYDGRTGETFDQAITVGYAYMLRLVHMVDDKIHARSTGPYSLVTQQPLRGRSKQGGQRLGEMEVWALEGYGAAFTLLEMLTIKSDDMTGRMTLWSNLILNKEISIGTPESFKVLICELQALCLDIGLFKVNGHNPSKKT